MNTKPYSRKLLVSVGIARLAALATQEAGSLALSMDATHWPFPCHFLPLPVIGGTEKDVQSRACVRAGRSSTIVLSQNLARQLKISIFAVSGNSTKTGAFICMFLSLATLGLGGRRITQGLVAWDIKPTGEILTMRVWLRGMSLNILSRMLQSPEAALTGLKVYGV